MTFDQAQRLSRETTREERPEIQRPVLADPPRNQSLGVGLVDGELDVGICLVVAKQDVVLRLVLLDEVVFERERFSFRVGHDELDVGNGSHHLVLALVQAPGLLEVAPDPISQRLGLADVDDVSEGILVQVDPRSGRDFPQFRLERGSQQNTWSSFHNGGSRVRVPIPLTHRTTRIYGLVGKSITSLDRTPPLTYIAAI